LHPNDKKIIMQKHFILYDLEYTSWQGALESNWSEPWQHKEIVQIAAIKLNNKLEIIDTFEIYVKPSINKVLSDYFVSLTGITNEHVNKYGISFNDAYKQFTQFCHELECLSYDKTDCPIADGKTFIENLSLNNMGTTDLRYRNIGIWINKQIKNKQISSTTVNSGRLAKLLKRDNNIIKYGLNEHNALYDVYSIREALIYFNFDYKND